MMLPLFSHRLRLASCAAFVLGLLTLVPCGVRASALSVHFHACSAGKAKLPARCGVVDVYEDRVARAGRILALHVIEIVAARPSDRAIFWNPGGPGGDDLSAVPLIADGAFFKHMLRLRDRYNLVFVDNRGTGLSHAIQCDLAPARHPELYYKQEFPDAPLRACRAARSKDTNLSDYTTDISADDLDDVRAALHLPKIVLDGGSYGTMFFLDYARRHAAHVESLVLQGVAPPGYLLIPLEDAQGAARAMDDLIADCARDSGCRDHYPHLGSHFGTLVSRIERGALPVRVFNAVTKRYQTVSLSREVFADRLRQALYANEAAAYVPYVVEQAYLRKYGPLALLIETVTQNFAQGLASGLNLSVTCAEDIPFISEAQIASTSTGSFQGDTRVRAQQHACAIWNVRHVSAAFIRPVRSDAPILMISGAEDPATPLEYGRDALHYLRNGRQVVIPHATHDTESDCVEGLITTFVRTQDAKGIDASRCVAISRRPPFATSMDGFGK